jgi:hypothetical protein
VNGSYINPALVGSAYERICFATLHVIIGIQNSLLEHLTVRLRHHETACLSELSLLTEGRDSLLHHISEVKQWRDFYDKDHKSEKQQRKEYYPLHIDAANDKTISDKDRSELESTRAPLYAIMRQRKSKRHKTRKSCRHMRTLPNIFVVL